MAKVLPVNGFVLSGTIGGVTFCRRGDGVYARAHVVPRDPRTPAQRGQRERFHAAVAAWRALPEPEKEALRVRAAREGRTGYHLFLAELLAAKGP